MRTQMVFSAERFSAQIAWKWTSVCVGDRVPFQNGFAGERLIAHRTFVGFGVFVVVVSRCAIGALISRFIHLFIQIFGQFNVLDFIVVTAVAELERIAASSDGLY